MTTNHDDPRKDRDDVAALLRLAGPRPAVPIERAERVRASTHAKWQEQIRRRSRARTLWTAAALATAASITAIVLQVVPTGTAPPGLMAGVTIESLTGTAWVHVATATNAPERRAVVAGEKIGFGSELNTADTGKVAIRLASGHSVRLDRSTQVRLLGESALALDRGALYVDSGSETEASEGLTVHTPVGVVREIGTQFEVRLEQGLIRVRLREGEVVVSHGDRTHPVSAGYELELDRDGSTATRLLEPYGPEWDWLADVTPMIDLDGRSARDFLEWVARERGWKLVFADENVVRAADEIVLDGRVETLTPVQALDAVLPTCRMTHRVENGVLAIAPDPDLEP